MRDFLWLRPFEPIPRPHGLREAGLGGAAVLVGLLLLPLPALADGQQTGTVMGTVVDVDDQPLPGVEVSLVAADGSRRTVTDGSGRYRFPTVRPGVVAVEASLLSLRQRKDAVVVYLGRTTTVPLRLEEADPDRPSDEVLPGPAESVQVVALAPLVDPDDTRVRSVVRREFLDVLPVERFYQSVALLLPDVVGGGDGNPNVGGALRGNNLFLIDGVDTTDPVTGLFGLNLAYEAIESVEVVTAGLPAELGRATGAAINVVTRSSDGYHRGTARILVEPDAGQSNYRQRPGPETLALEIEAANSEADDTEALAATLGGPLLANNRAWYFAAWQDGESSIRRPTLAGDLWDGGVGIEAGLLRFGWRLGENHSFDAQYTYDSASFLAFSPLLDSAENTTGKPQSAVFGGALIVPVPGDLAAITGLGQEGNFAKLDWNAVLGPAWTLEVTAAGQDRTLERSRSSRTGRSGDAIHADITSLADDFFELEPDDVFDVLTLYNGISDLGRELRPRGQGGLSIGWFGGGERLTHDLRLGFDYQSSESEVDLVLPGIENIDRQTGELATGQLFVDLGPDPVCLAGGPCGSYDPATGSFGPFLLINAPSRPVSRSRSEDLAIYVSDALRFGRWLVSLGLRWESQVTEEIGGGQLMDHRALAPRIGVKLDALGDGSVLYSLNLGRYYEPFPQGFVDSFVRPDFFYGSSSYLWAGVTDPACATADPNRLDSPCWLAAGVFDQEPLQAVPLDPDLRRSYMDEAVIGYERRLGPKLGLELYGVYRQWGDLWDDVIFLDPSRNQVTHLDAAKREHQALRLSIQKRFADRWQMLASITRSRTEGNLFGRRGDDTFFDFTDLGDGNLTNRFGPAPYDRPTQLRIFALCELPLGSSALTFGTAFAYGSGAPWQSIAIDTTRGAAVFLDPRGSRRLDEQMQWDLSLVADIDTGTDLELLTKLEIFNVLDAQTQVGVETDTALEGFGQPRGLVDIQEPRRLRFSIELRF